MGTTADVIVARFFKRRDEAAGEVHTVADAVGFLNECQQELLGLKLIIKEATVAWPANDEEVDLPADFSAMATDRGYMDGWARLWQDYDGPTSNGLFIVPGRLKIRLYPAPSSTTEIKFKYFAQAENIASDPVPTAEVMNGIVAPALDKYLLYRMLEIAALIDDEGQTAAAYGERADKAKAELIIWKQNTYGTDQAAWTDDPAIVAHDTYVAGY